MLGSPRSPWGLGKYSERKGIISFIKYYNIMSYWSFWWMFCCIEYITKAFMLLNSVWLIKGLWLAVECRDLWPRLLSVTARGASGFVSTCALVMISQTEHGRETRGLYSPTLEVLFKIICLEQSRERNTCCQNTQLHQWTESLSHNSSLFISGVESEYIHSSISNLCLSITFQRGLLNCVWIKISYWLVVTRLRYLTRS